MSIDYSHLCAAMDAYNNGNSRDNYEAEGWLCENKAAIAEELLRFYDLPAPDDCPPDIHKPGWRLAENKYAAVLAGNIHISDKHGWGMSYSSREVREVAYKLLAAADHAEGVRT